MSLDSIVQRREMKRKKRKDKDVRGRDERQKMGAYRERNREVTALVRKGVKSREEE